MYSARPAPKLVAGPSNATRLPSRDHATFATCVTGSVWMIVWDGKSCQNDPSSATPSPSQQSGGNATAPLRPANVAWAGTATARATREAVIQTARPRIRMLLRGGRFGLPTIPGVWRVGIRVPTLNFVGGGSARARRDRGLWRRGTGLRSAC